MSGSISLRVKWTEETVKCFEEQGIDDPWSEEELIRIETPEPPLTVEDLSIWIEARIEGLYYKQTEGAEQAQVQATSIKLPDQEQPLPWTDLAHKYLKDGDTIVVDCVAVTDFQAPPRYTEEDLEQIRKKLRFDLNDRVLCNIGARWIPGHVVGTAVPDDMDLLPYLVKTDPIPGLPARTISVPYDKNEVCVQEVCFDPRSQLYLVKAAAPLLAGSQKPKLRFVVGDKVVCRIRSNPNDGLENWVEGTVGAAWPELPGPVNWQVEDVTGKYPSNVPYKVDLSAGGWVFCHRDHHTLIRRQGFEPQTRVKGVSKRLEIRKAKDGSRQQVDHQTERSKTMMESDSDSD